MSWLDIFTPISADVRKRGREMRAEMAREREVKLRERAVRALERIAEKEAD